MSPPTAQDVARDLLAKLDLELVSLTTMQSLWAGYGKICAVTARAPTPRAARRWRPVCGRLATDPDDVFRLVLKFISPPAAAAAKAADEGHLRKMLSYDVEQLFYRNIAPGLRSDVCVASRLACSFGGAIPGTTAIVMTDLRLRFPVAGEKRAVLSPTQVRAAVAWLARFHGSTMGLARPKDLDSYVLPPLEEQRRREADASRERSTKLWLNGGYTYLATRRTEFAALAGDAADAWSRVLCKPPRGWERCIAEVAADFLTPRGRPFESLIHGDVKSENLFSTEAGDEVAFFDFQYVGLGVGACDLAKLFTCSVPLKMLTDDGDGEEKLGKGEEALLRSYLELVIESRRETEPWYEYEWDDFKRHWETALVDWCRFQASWGFWGNTEWLEGRVRFIVSDEGWRAWIKHDAGLDPV